MPFSLAITCICNDGQLLKESVCCPLCKVVMRSPSLKGLCCSSWPINRVGRSFFIWGPGRVAQLVGHLTRKPGVLGLIPGLATYFRFSFRFFKKGSCQLLAKVCARSTG